MPDEKTGRLDEEYVVQMKGITKVYPNGVAANQGVDFNLRRGEIHALMGENGAGKVYAYEDAVRSGATDERRNLGARRKADTLVPHRRHFPRDRHGASALHACTEPDRGGKHGARHGARASGLFIDHAKAVAITKEYAEKYNLHVEPEAKVMDIPVGMKQKVEILKALVRGAKILILDEPTAVLTTQETVELFKELRHLKEQGYTIVFISHKLNEIMEITDRLTIMRGGRSMGVYNTCDVTKEEISRLMVGRDVILNVQKDKANPSDVVLRVRDVEYVNEWHKKMLDKISFDVRRGEILGVAGVEGNGQKELVDMLFGFLTPNAGSVTLGSESILGLSQQKLRDRGVALIPEDRMLYGIAGSASIEENLISDRSAEKRLNHGPLFNMKAIHDEADKLIEDYAVLCKSRKQQVGMLSGGNIQKVVVAREFSGNPVLILADQPTRGIDVGATEFIRKKLVELSRSGIAVLLISADLAEVMELSDSLIVMHGGKIAAYFEDTSTLTDDVMGEYMLGLKTQSEEEIRRVCHD